MSALIKNLVHNKIGLLIIAAAVIALLLVAGLPRTVYHQGWEVKTDIVAIDHEGNIITDVIGIATPDDDNGPQGGATGFFTRNVMGPALWKFDLDQATYGLPDLEIMTSDVRVKQGVWPYADLEKLFEAHKYIVTFKEYLFDVQVRTVADSNMYASGWDKGNRWEHETACPYSWHSVGGTWEEGRTGEEFSGSIYVRFAVHPWGQFDFGPAPDGYEFTQYWAGLMNVKLEEKDMGKVASKPNLFNDAYEQSEASQRETHIGWVRGLPSDGAQLNMYVDDGTYAQGYAAVPWDVNKVLDPDIHSVIILQVPFEIMAGAYEDYGAWEYGFTGAINNLYPVDYYFTATIRVETFIVKELTARDPIAPIDPSPIDPPVDYYDPNIPTWLEQNWMWIIVAIIVVFVIIVVFLGPYLGIGLGVLLGFIRICRPERGDYG